MYENFNKADFLHEFLVAEPLNGIFKFLDMLYVLCCSIVKSLLPVLKNQNGGYIQDGVENVNIFHPIFSKMTFMPNFLLYFLIIWVKIKLLRKNFFLKIQNGGIT
jgi:hypothetical protein